MTDDLRNDLDEYLKAWGDAIVSNDADAIARFSLADWRLVTPEAGPIDSAVFLEAVRSGDLTHDTFEVDVHYVSMLGDAAVAVAHVRNSGTYRGTPFSADEWATDVFVRRDGGWICALSALTPRIQAA
jgi:ketosteroid isomerase-like protein